MNTYVQSLSHLDDGDLNIEVTFPQPNTDSEKARNAIALLPWVKDARKGKQFWDWSNLNLEVIDDLRPATDAACLNELNRTIAACLGEVYVDDYADRAPEHRAASYVTITRDEGFLQINTVSHNTTAEVMANTLSAVWIEELICLTDVQLLVLLNEHAKVLSDAALVDIIDRAFNRTVPSISTAGHHVYTLEEGQTDVLTVEVPAGDTQATASITGRPGQAVFVRFV